MTKTAPAAPAPASALPSISRVKMIGGNQFAIELSNGKTFTATAFRDPIHARAVLAQFGYVTDLGILSGLSDSKAVRAWKAHIDSLEARGEFADQGGHVIPEDTEPEPEREYELVMLKNFECHGVHRKGAVVATIHIAEGGPGEGVLRSILANMQAGVSDLRPMASVPA